MVRTAPTKAARAYLPAAANLAAAAGVIAILAAGIRITGSDIIGVYLQTPYRDYPLFLIGVPIVLACLFCVRAVIAAIQASGKTALRTPAPVTILTPGIILLFCVLALTFFRSILLHIPTASPSAPGLFRSQAGPVVQFGPFTGRRADASTGAVIWYFDPEGVAAPAVILFGTAPEPERMATVAEAAGDGKRHEFRLTGLAPSTRYFYRVPALDGRVHSFRTAPTRGSDAVVRFTALGDTGNTRRGDAVASYYPDVIRAAQRHYAVAGGEPDFRLHAGDMVRTGDSLDAWREFFSSDAMAASVPGVFIPGNHEYAVDGGSNFRYFFGQPDYYSIDYGDARIIGLHPFDGPGRTLDGPILSTGKEQYRWAREELARSDGVKWLIVAIHIPVLSTGDYGTSELLAAQYFDLFREHGVDLVISGHDHNFDLFRAEGGPLYLVAGTGGSHLDSYILDRRERTWPGWINRPGAPSDGGPAKWRHLYGELSWGFTDVTLTGAALTVSYYRWLGFERFLAITGQDRLSWDMVDLRGIPRAGNDLTAVEPVISAEKTPWPPPQTGN